MKFHNRVHTNNYLLRIFLREYNFLKEDIVHSFFSLVLMQFANSSEQKSIELFLIMTLGLNFVLSHLYFFLLHFFFLLKSTLIALTKIKFCIHKIVFFCRSYSTITTMIQRGRMLFIYLLCCSAICMNSTNLKHDSRH